MKRTVIILTALAAMIISAPLFAGSSTANLSVTASVANNCTMTTAPVAFGAYDPVVANAATDLPGTGTINVSCTKGASATIDLGVGGNLSGGSRRMADGTDFLGYALYTDLAHTTVWGTGLAGGTTKAYTSTSKAPFAITVYGNIPQNQDVGAGSYSDTVVATVNF